MLNDINACMQIVVMLPSLFVRMASQKVDRLCLAGQLWVYLQLSARNSNASRSQYFYEDQIVQISGWSFILSYGVICSPRQPLMKLSTLQLEGLICMIAQLTTPYTGKLAFNGSVKRPVSTPFVHSSRSVLGISSKRCSSLMLRKFNLFLTIIGTLSAQEYGCAWINGVR